MWKHLLLAAGLLAAGFFAGWKANDSNQVPAENLVQGTSSGALTAIVPADPAPSETELEAEPLTVDSPPDAIIAALNDGSLKGKSEPVILLRQLIESDPVSALVVLNSCKPWVRKKFIDDLYASWVKVDPSAALTSAQTETPEVQSKIFENLGVEFARVDPERALEIGRDLKAGGPRNDFLTSVFDALFVKDPIDACSRLAEFPGADIFDFARLYPYGILDPPDFSVDLMNGMLEALPSDRANRIVGTIFSEYWKNTDVDEAREWLFNLPEGALRQQLADEVLWDDCYGEKCYAQLLEMNLTPAERLRLSVNRSAFLATEDPLVGLESAAAITDPESRVLAERSVFGTWMANDAAAAIDYLKTERPADLRLFVSDIAGELEDLEHEEALASALEITSVSEDSGLLQHVFERIAEDDITLATSHLATLPAGRDRDAGILGILEEPSKITSSDRLEWTLAISDAETRNRQTEEHLSSWARRNPAAAGAWLESRRDELEPELHGNLADLVEEAAALPIRRSREVSSGFGKLRVYY